MSVAIGANRRALLAAHGGGVGVSTAYRGTLAGPARALGSLANGCQPLLPLEPSRGLGRGAIARSRRTSAPQRRSWARVSGVGVPSSTSTPRKPCVLALLIPQVVEHTTGESWFALRAELKRLQATEFTTANHPFLQRTEPTPELQRVFKKLEISWQSIPSCPSCRHTPFSLPPTHPLSGRLISPRACPRSGNAGRCACRRCAAAHRGRGNRRPRADWTRPHARLARDRPGCSPCPRRSVSVAARQQIDV